MKNIFPFLLGFMMAGSVLAGEQEEFVKLLEKEAAQLDVDQQPVQPERATEQSAGEDGASGRDGTTREAFEKALEKHKGTFAIYRTLVERDKAEVFKAYQSGASFSQIRKMVIKRELNP